MARDKLNSVHHYVIPNAGLSDPSSCAPLNSDKYVLFSLTAVGWYSKDVFKCSFYKRKS